MAVPPVPPYSHAPPAESVPPYRDIRLRQTPTLLVQPTSRPIKFPWEEQPPRVPGPNCVPTSSGNAWFADTPQFSNEQLHTLFRDHSVRSAGNCEFFCPVKDCRRRLNTAGPTVLHTVCTHCRFVVKRNSPLWACTYHGKCSQNFHFVADRNGACFYCVDCVYQHDFFAPVDRGEHNYAEHYLGAPMRVSHLWWEQVEARNTKRRSAASSSTSQSIPASPLYGPESLVWTENFRTLHEQRRK